MFVVFLQLQHVMLLVMCCLEFAIPDVPHNIATKMARVEYLRREALRVRGSVFFVMSSFAHLHGISLF